MQICSAEREHFTAILKLNEESVEFLSPLSRGRLETLHRRATYHRVALAGEVVIGFLLAFADTANHDSPNFQWFAERGAGFIYVDRIVVRSDSRGSGVGSLLYADLIAFATAHGSERLTCEIDAEPPNHVSEDFHSRLGFIEVGSQWVEYEPGHRKRVSLRELGLGEERLTAPERRR